jgi:hypothetical protein
MVDANNNENVQYEEAKTCKQDATPLLQHQQSNVTMRD